MAPQLPALVTVNWPLSEAVRVFYGRPFVWTLSGFTPVRGAELPTAAAPRDSANAKAPARRLLAATFLCPFGPSLRSSPGSLSVCPLLSLQGQGGKRLALC